MYDNGQTLSYSENRGLMLRDLLTPIGWRELIREILTMALIVGVLQFVLPRSVVKGSSMEPNLQLCPR